MGNIKTARKALMSSVTALLLCVTMLMGTTFAWFTDTATVSVNMIRSGTLDIELYYQNAAATEFSVADADTKDLFVSKDGKDILWEPGAASVCYLKIENLGNLSLRYVLSVIGDDVITGSDGAALSKVLKTAAVEITEAEVGTFDRDTAIARATADDAEGLLNYKKNGEMLPEDVHYVAMVVYYPKEVGNVVDGALYNRSDVKLTTELYLSLVATQATVEFDSIDNLYDAGALLPEIPIVMDVEKAFNITVANGGSATYGSADIAVPAEAVEQDVNGILRVKFISSTSNETVYDIALVDEEGNIIPLKKKATVNLDLGFNRKNVKVLHNGVEMDPADYSYNPANGKITVTADSFSPYTITYETNYEASMHGEGYSLFDAIKQAKDGEIITLLQDVKTVSSAEYFFNADNVVVDLNGHTVEGRMRIAYGDNITFKNGTFINTETSTNLVINAIDVTFENIKGKTSGTFAQIGNGANVTFSASSEIVSNTCGFLAVHNGTTINVYGKISVSGNSAAIQGNGSQSSYGGTVVNVYDGAELYSNSIGIYQPQNGTVNIYGGTVSGRSGIGLKNGTLNIYGGTVYGFGEDRTPPPQNSSGINWCGAGIQIETNKSYSGDINVSIAGGTVKSDNSYAVYEYIDKSTDQTKSNLKSLNITGGALIPADGMDAIALSEPAKKLIG